MQLYIRDEQPQDFAEVSLLIQSTFRDIAYSSQTEHLIVDALRASDQLSISLVAQQHEKIVGHVAVSPVTLSNGEQGWYGLGPIAVLPQQQNLGIGAQLMHAALTQLKQQHAQGCVLLGDPDYYARFGFQTVEGLWLANVPKVYFQALSFTGTFPQAEVFYAQAFSVT